MSPHCLAKLSQGIIHSRSKFRARLSEATQSWSGINITILCSKLTGYAYNTITGITQSLSHRYAAAHVLAQRIKTSQRLKGLCAHIRVEVTGSTDDEV